MLRKEEQLPIWRVTANILNKQSRTADKGWSSILGVGSGANNSSLQKRILLQNVYKESLGPGLILLCDIRNGKGAYGSSGRDVGVWTRSSWLRIMSGSGKLRMRQ